MPYTITLSDGLTGLITIPDRAILGPLELGAPSNCSLNLVGRGSVAYGVATATNAVWMLEHFANPTPPVQPLHGQIWYETVLGNATLQLFNTANQWVQIATADSPFTSDGDITVYDHHGDSATLGCNGTITLIRPDYQPWIKFEGAANAPNAVQLLLGSDKFGNPDLTLDSPAWSQPPGFLWHASNLHPFDVDGDNTLTGTNNFTGWDTFAAIDLYNPNAPAGSQRYRIENDLTTNNGQLLLSKVGDAGGAAANHVFAALTISPTDGSLALIGHPTAPTPAADGNTAAIATTAYVLGQASSIAPLMDGAATAGASPRWTRGDHVHPTDSTRAALDSPALTGVPTTPDPPPGSNDNTIADTRFVQAAALARALTPGPPGNNGADGVNGTNGVNGGTGPKGDKGDPGPQGPAGGTGGGSAPATGPGGLYTYMIGYITELGTGDAETGWHDTLGRVFDASRFAPSNQFGASPIGASVSGIWQYPGLWQCMGQTSVGPIPSGDGSGNSGYFGTTGLFQRIV